MQKFGSSVSKVFRIQSGFTSGFCSLEILSRYLSTWKGHWIWVWLPDLNGTLLARLTGIGYSCKDQIHPASLTNQFYQSFRLQFWAIIYSLRLYALKKLLAQGNESRVTARCVVIVDLVNWDLQSAHLATLQRLCPDVLHFHSNLQCVWTSPFPQKLFLSGESGSKSSI